MPLSASPLSALPGTLTARDVETLSPTIVCAQTGSVLAQVSPRSARRAWPSSTYTDPAAAARAVSLRDPRLALVGGSSLPWVIEAVRTLRRVGSQPIAVAATPIRADDAMTLLGAGASLIVEPAAHARELTARLVALVLSSAAEDLRTRWLQSGALRVDLGARRCTIDDAHVPLSNLQFELLVLLMNRAQQVVPHHEIIHHLWGWRHENAENTLRLHVGRLRRKLGDSPRSPRWVRSVRGAGYQFLPAVAELGQDRSEGRLRQTVAMLSAQSDALNALIDALLAATTAQEASETVVQWATSRGLSDAATVFRLDVGAAGPPRSTLIASAGMSARWRQAVATGHPIAEGFIGSQVYASGEPVQLRDIAQWAKRFPVTARMSSAEDLHACLLFPLHLDGRVWGDIAFVSRTGHAFTPARTTFLRTVSGIVSLSLAAQTAQAAPSEHGHA